jgi:type I restriction enzyme S subunit
MSDFVPGGWKFAKLDDVAEERSDRIDNPSKSGYDRFVGLEHLDSGELTVRRWGSTADLLSAMKLFKSGDILIGRRNAYLKRASKAEFDGVCSGDAYVVREKKGKIAEGLLPIILNSDSFWDYTIAHASGTMSKRAKWRDLAEYSFLLPSPEEQRCIATTLWAVEDCIVKGERFHTVAERAKQVLLKEIFERSLNGGLKNWEKTSLSKCIVERSEGSKPPHKKIKYIGLEHFESGNHHLVSYGDSEKFGSNCSVFEKGDILYSKLRPYLDKVALANFDGVCTTEVIVLNANEKTTNKFLINLLHSKKFVEWTTHRSYGTKMPRTSIDLIGKYNFLLPPLPEQLQIAAILTRCNETITAARANVRAAKALKMKLINEMISPKSTNPIYAE